MVDRRDELALKGDGAAGLDEDATTVTPDLATGGRVVMVADFDETESSAGGGLCVAPPSIPLGEKVKGF